MNPTEPAPPFRAAHERMGLWRLAFLRVRRISLIALAWLVVTDITLAGVRIARERDWLAHDFFHQRDIGALASLTVNGEATFNGAINPSCETITYAATVNVDASTNPCKVLALTGDVVVTTSNLTAGRVLTLTVTSDSSLRLVSFPSGWTFHGSRAPVNIAPSKKMVLSLTSTSTADSGVSVVMVDQGVGPVVIQRVQSHLREDVTCPNSQIIPGTRRQITTTFGDLLDITYHVSGASRTLLDDANLGVAVTVDGQAPEYHLRNFSINAPGSGENFAFSGNARVHVAPGSHIVSLQCEQQGGDGSGYFITVEPFNNQQENGADLTIEEVLDNDFALSQIPQVVHTDMILVADWRADAGVTVDGSNRVTAWADQSGAGNNLTQSTVGLRPLLVANCQNKLPCIRFDPTRMDALTLSLVQTTAQRLIFLGNHNHQTTNVRLTQCSGANCAFIFLGKAAANDKPALDSGGARATTASAVTGKHLLEFRWNTAGGTNGIRTDLGIGASEAEETSVVGFNQPIGTVTTICGDAGGGAGCDLDAYEIQIWQANANEADLTKTDDTFVRDLLNRRWAVYTEHAGN